LLPRQDQLQEICIEFYIQSLRISEFEAFLRFLEWYAGCLRQTFENGLKNGNVFIDSGEEIMLECSMVMVHGKKRDGKEWVKAIQGYVSKNAK
jgi:predicted Rdx family selenoprotein